MEQLQVGVDTSMIALWLWHKSVAVTQTYLHIHLLLGNGARQNDAAKQQTGSLPPGR
jgi:hypothetical protein